MRTSLTPDLSPGTGSRAALCGGRRHTAPGHIGRPAVCSGKTDDRGVTRQERPSPQTGGPKRAATLRSEVIDDKKTWAEKKTEKHEPKNLESLERINTTREANGSFGS